MCILFSQTFSDARLWLIVPHREKNGKSSLATGLPFGNSLGLIQAVGQIERIRRRRDWHAVDVGNIRTKLLPIVILDMGDRVSPLGSFLHSDGAKGVLPTAAEVGTRAENFWLALSRAFRHRLASIDRAKA
jgi:hypothetical protein